MKQGSCRAHGLLVPRFLLRNRIEDRMCCWARPGKRGMVDPGSGKRPSKLETRKSEGCGKAHACCGRCKEV